MSPQSRNRQNAVNHGKPGERGQTLVLFLLMMVMLFVFVGMGIDLGFAYITKARLSKAVDSAALSGMRNINQGQSAASLIASNAFAANYGASGRDVAGPALTVSFSTVNGGNTAINVDATVAINTYFIRVLPAIGLGNWNTLTVHSGAQAIRSTLIMSLVLDKSGSMNNNGGAQALPPAVTNFIALFDDQTDYASQISFSSVASVDVPMTQPFITRIQDAALALENNFGGDTCSDEGLTNGMAQINMVTNVTAQSIVQVMVFFTDGMANTFNYVFDCGSRDIGDASGNNYSLFPSSSGCNVPSTISSISPTTGTLTANAVATSGSSACQQMHQEAENRAEWIAYQARAQGYTIYAIGMGNPNDAGECGFPVVNPAFLENLANTTDSSSYVQGQPTGDFALATDSSQLNSVFQTIAAKILLRLSR
jgi:Flp pilus assembly protein TadG